MSDYKSREHGVRLMATIEFPALEQFAGFVAGQGSLVAQLADELDELLSRGLGDQELVQVLTTHGAEHVPQSADDTTRGWLIQVRRTLTGG